jgi:hypothetical protein
MRRRAATAVPAALLLACAAHAPHGQLDVLLADEPDSPVEQRVVQAVQDAVNGSGDSASVWSTRGSKTRLGPPSTDGLVCTPSIGAVLLRCSPSTVGSGGQTVTVVVSRMGIGYQVAIDQAWSLPGRTPAVCGVQRRIAAAINSISPGAARVDAHSGCTGE